MVAMNFSDSEIVAPYCPQTDTQVLEADLVLVNTCSIREAEQTVRNV
jgi:tRNA A37 methylthiotransferase MiaB